MSNNRRALHAGTWYSNSPGELKRQLDEWLSKVQSSSNLRPARAIISPHAGYTYCGACAAHAYKQIDPSKVKRVFILGPSHHVRLMGCALSQSQYYNTPLYNLTIDTEVYEELFSTGDFEWMSRSTDEDEHSIEMQLPYIAKVMESRRDQFTVVPVLVGALTTEKEVHYGRIFSKYLNDPSSLFVISSDFCHWGTRFRFTHYDKQCGEIWQSIENLDRLAMDNIEKLDPHGFSMYLKKYSNTICGRHPIGVLLNAVNALMSNGNGHRISLKFLKYAQSSQCRASSDSSVSYAAAALAISP